MRTFQLHGDLENKNYTLALPVRGAFYLPPRQRPGTGNDPADLSVRLSVCPSHLFFALTRKCIAVLLRGCVKFFLANMEKFPFTYWLNGRWFLQIVDREFEHGVKWKVVSPDIPVGIYIQRPSCLVHSCLPLSLFNQ